MQTPFLSADESDIKLYNVTLYNTQGVSPLFDLQTNSTILWLYVSVMNHQG